MSTAVNQLIRDSITLEKADASREKYHGIVLSHTGVDKPFVRRLRDDLRAHVVPRLSVAPRTDAENLGDDGFSGARTMRDKGIVPEDASRQLPRRSGWGRRAETQELSLTIESRNQ